MSFTTVSPSELFALRAHNPVFARSYPLASKTKNSPMAVFALFGCGGSGARRNDRTVVNKVPFGTLEPYGDRARRREGFEPHVLAFSLRRKCCGQFGGSDLPPAGHSLPPHPPSYSPFGLITLSLCVHTLSHAKQKHMCNKLKFEKGFEFSRLAAAQSGSALTAVQAGRADLRPLHCGRNPAVHL